MKKNVVMSQLAVKLRALCMSLLLALLLPTLFGQQARAQTADEQTKYNVVLLIDESGSMWCPLCNDEESPSLDTVPKDDWLPLYKTPPMRLKAVEGLFANMAVEPKLTSFNVGIVSYHNEVTKIADLQPVGAGDNLLNMMKALYANHERTWGEFKRSPISATGGELFTNTAGALQQAYDMLFDASGKPRAGGKNIVLMISDGVPQISGSTKEIEFTKVAQLVQKVTTAKGEFVSLLIFNPNAQPAARVSPADRSFWADLAKGPGLSQACDYWEVSESKLLFQSTQGILRCLLTGNSTVPTGIRLKQAEPQYFAVEGYIKELSITIRKSHPGSVVKVFRPNGKELPKLAEGTDAGDNIKYKPIGSSESYNVVHPSGEADTWVGCWKLSVEAAIEADKDVPIDVAPLAYAADYTLKFNQPSAAIWQVGKPLPLSVSILDDTGQVKNPSDLKISGPMSLGIQRPGGGGETRSLQAQGSSYIDTYVAPITGTYTLTVALNAADLLKPSAATAACQNNNILQGKPGQIASQHQVRMELQPWLNLTSPKQGDEVGSDKFKAQAQVMLGTAGATDDTLVKGDVKAQVVSRNDNKVVKTYVLQRDASVGAGMYSRQPSDISTLPSGDYSLIVSFNGKIANDTAVLTDTAQVDFKLIQVVPPTAIPTVAPTPTNTAVPPTVVPPSPTPTPLPPCPDGMVRNEKGECVPGPEFPWWILGVLGLLGVGGLGFFLWRGMTGRAQLDGLRLEPSGMGAPILLRGTQATHQLGGANLQFVATNPSGMPTMTILSAPEQVMVNGSPRNKGDKVPLSATDTITVGSETFTLDGIPRSKRGAKSTLPTDDYGGISSGDYSGY